MSDTKLIRYLNEEGVYPQRWNSKDDVDQGAVDAVAEKVLGKLSAEDIAAHNIAAYSSSVSEYREKKVNSLVVPELPHFINLMPNDGLVLDIASGHLRDPLYMIDPCSREDLNREGMTSPSENKKLNVIIHDGSYAFLRECENKLSADMLRVPFMFVGDFMKPGTGVPYYSRNAELEDEDGRLEKIFTQGKLEPILDGIWSCAGLMVHLLPERFAETISGWGKSLKSGGVFAVSYIKKKEGQSSVKLLASRSAPGEIKVFSHYDPQEVDEAFESAGMRLIDMSSGNYDGHGHVLTDFFGSVMYRKK